MPYFVFDLPGQAELFTMSGSLHTIIDVMRREWGISLAAVQLIDSHLCMDASKYLAGLLHSLATMLHLELPMVNVLSKIDVLRRSVDGAGGDGGGAPASTSGRGGPDLEVEFFTEGVDLWRLPPLIQTYRRSANAKYRRLAERLCELVEDYSLVSFVTLDAGDDGSLGALLAHVDASVGFVDSAFGQMQLNAYSDRSLRESFRQQRGAA